MALAINIFKGPERREIIVRGQSYGADPPSPSPPGECVGAGGGHSLGGEGGWVVNILEDVRHSPVLYVCKYFVVQNIHLTRSLLEERIDIELELELGHVQVLDVLLYGGAALDPLPSLLLGVIRVSSSLLGGPTAKVKAQCCGSGMFIPDPGSDFFHPGSGSRIRTVSIPDPGSASKNLCILTQKNCF